MDFADGEVACGGWGAAEVVAGGGSAPLGGGSGAGEEERALCDGDGAAAGNCQGGGVDGTAGETGVGAVERVVDGALGGGEGDGVGAAAGWVTDRARRELGVEPCGALGEPVAAMSISSLKVGVVPASGPSRGGVAVHLA